MVEFSNRLDQLIEFAVQLSPGKIGQPILSFLHVMQAPAPPKEPAKEEAPKFSAFQGKARTLKG